MEEGFLMPPMPDRRLTVLKTTALLVLLGTVVAPIWAEETQDAIREKERTARIQELQQDRAIIESELRLLQSMPEGVSRSTVPRSEFSDQPTRNIKESLESVPGVSMRQGSSGRDWQLSIRGSK
jgi:outer membrane receptor for ferrienterochelin and colicin